MSVFTVCIVDNSEDLVSKRLLLCNYHSALHRIHPAAHVTVLYNGGDRGPCFITSTPDAAKFRAKVEEARVHDVANEECILLGLHKLLGVWRKRVGEAGRVVVNLVLFSATPTDLCIDLHVDIHVDHHVDFCVDRAVCQRDVHELLCRQLHLCPLYSTDDCLLGLVKLPLLDLPDSHQSFDDRAIKLYKVKPKRAESQLIVADCEMPVLVVDLQLLAFRWMDDEGLFYECSECLYRLAETATEPSPCIPSPLSIHRNVQRIIVGAHLDTSSVVNLRQVNGRSASKVSAAQLYAYQQVLFNPEYPLIYQLSRVLLAATTQPQQQSSSEKDLLLRLLQAVSEYCSVNSPDLFPHAAAVNLDVHYRTLQEELLIVAEIKPSIGEQIRAVFRDDQPGEPAVDRKKRKTGYLQVDKASPPTVPPIADPLLQAYYQQYHSFY